MSICVKGLQKSKFNFHIKIVAIRLYCLLGALKPAVELFKSLETKHIQMDTFSHLILHDALSLYIPDSSETVTYAMERYYLDSLKEVRNIYICKTYLFNFNFLLFLDARTCYISIYKTKLFSRMFLDEFFYFCSYLVQQAREFRDFYDKVANTAQRAVHNIEYSIHDFMANHNSFKDALDSIKSGENLVLYKGNLYVKNVVIKLWLHL